RALAAALFFLIVNLLGAGLGPFLTGALSDWIAADYGDASLRWALLGVCVVFGALAALHYALVARTIRYELQVGD
ncbi:MAG: MFS transporter, partial [Pseudomonadota bacterium]